MLGTWAQPGSARRALTAAPTNGAGGERPALPASYPHDGTLQLSNNCI